MRVAGVSSFAPSDEEKRTHQGTKESHERGTYVLVLELTHRRVMNVGSLGRIRFAGGYYAYTGSARRGMRARVVRHLAREKRKKWHVDWLTTQPDVLPIAIASTRQTGLECKIAAVLSSGADMLVKGFGCSDCECVSHLCYFSDSDALSLALKDLRRYGVSVEQVSSRVRHSSRHPCL